MKKLLVIVLIIAGLSSCRYDPKPKTLFTLMPAEETGIDFSNNLTDTEEFNIVEYLNYYNGAGVAAGDINNDGLVDLYFAANQTKNRLFLNKGNLKFRDITDKAGIACPGDWKTGVSMADVNGDGLLDIYVCQVGNYKTVQGRNFLYINNGDLTFKEQTSNYGLQFNGFSTQSLFFDYDNDGDLDMFLLNHAIHSSGSYGHAALVRYTRNRQTGDKLYKQIKKDGKPYFINVTETAGIFSSRIGYGLGVSAGDLNNDGFIDLYISNDFHENDYMYFNNGDGTFTEKIRASVGHTTKSSMGNDMSDFNNDGLLDVFSLDMFPFEEEIIKKSAGEEMMDVYDMKADLGYYYQLSRNALQLNRGNELFSEIAAFAGVHATDWSWSPLFFDADNDGFKDLFITNGIPRRPNDLDYLQFIEDNTSAINSTGPDRISNIALINQMPADTTANFAFKNNGDLSFCNNAQTWGMQHRSFSNTGVYADLDNDGDLDYVVSNLNEPCFIYRNNAEYLTNNSFVKIKLQGPKRNKDGFGARVEVWLDSMVQVQQVIPVRGAMSSSDPSPTFGLGDHNLIDSIKVYWPQNRLEVRRALPANQTLVFNFSESKANTESSPDIIPNFTDITDSMEIAFRHHESRSADFVHQPLLPHRLSNLGPGMATADVNGDRNQDFFIGGGANQSAALFLQIDESFTLLAQKEFAKYADGEDVDAKFLDVDEDGDLDLMTAQGSSEHLNKPELNRVVLFLNDGQGNFERSHTYLTPSSQPTCIAPDDFDDDGDIDVFIGCRPNLLAYGYPGRNMLLINNGSGNFSEILPNEASLISSIGMVTDAQWGNVDADPKNELIVVGEWMGVKVFKYLEGSFRDLSVEFGLTKSGGWWNHILLNDIDDDGDLDMVAGNLGLNAKIKGQQENAAVLYAKDFDGNGKIDPITCTNRNGITVPFATRDDLIAQIPSLKNKFSTYAKYAGVKSIEDVFSADQLEGAVISYSHEFRSVVFENNSNGSFIRHPLPSEAQLFPVFTIHAEDLDHDGTKDIILAGNLYEAHITYGRYDAGYGLFLKGRGDFKYTPIPTDQSGLILKGEVRGIEPFQLGNQRLLLVSKSNAPLQIIKKND